MIYQETYSRNQELGGFLSVSPCSAQQPPGPGQHVGGGACAGRTNLIVNYLPQSVAEKDLYAMFTSVGPVESCRVMKDFKVRGGPRL
jgi:RNA recognition motif-containing protein